MRQQALYKCSILFYDYFLVLKANPSHHYIFAVEHNILLAFRCLSVESLTITSGISRNFRNARQEDAHEYMVNLLESMHKCCLPSGVPSESPSAYEKSLVHKIFGGRLRSQVIIAA